jgi:EmrB/QacA subfamily drug resistance transporter
VRPLGGRGGAAERHVVLTVAAMASFLTPFMATSVNIALPSIGAEFSVDAVTLSWVTTVYLLAAAMLLVPMGRLADIRGRKKVFLAGMVGYTLVSALCTLSVSARMLIALRALQGLSDAMMFGTSTAIVTSVYPREQRGRALGITVAAVYSGGSLGPFVGGFLTQLAGWRSIFWLTTFLGVVVVAMTLWKMRGEWADARGQKMDVVGSVLYAGALLGIMFGFRLLPSANGAWVLLAGGAALVGFVLRERRISFPVLELGLFRANRVFAFSCVAALVNYAATYALSFLLSLYLQYLLRLGPRDAGLVMLAQPVMMALFSPLAGRLSERIEPRIIASTGMALSAIGLTLTAFLGAAPPLGSVVAVLLLCGFGFALFSSPNTSAIMGSVERQQYGVASATTAVMRLVGQMLSMGIAALIISLYVGEVSITPERYPAFLRAFRAAFLLFALLCCGGIAASLARGRVRRPGTAQG